MNNDAFLRHHGLSANPFRGEEARQDLVFDRIEGSFRHPDFDKILGDLAHPSSSVVFGERGSGKTAIRLQIERILKEREMSTDDGGPRVWMLTYDDFNDNIARFMRSLGDDDPSSALPDYQLVDHMDGLLGRAVPRVVDGILLDHGEDAPKFGSRSEVKKAIRTLPSETRARILRMQVCYDRPGLVASRTRKLKGKLRVRGGSGVATAKWGTIFFFLLALTLGVVGYLEVNEHIFGQQWVDENWKAFSLAGLVGLVGVYMSFRWLMNAWRVRWAAKKVARTIRVDDRDLQSYRDGLRHIPKDDFNERELPLTDSQGPRYMYFDALIDLMQALNYDSMMVLVDRLDEPSAINGDAQRMKAFIWPMLNNKFLQMRGVGFKMLLPIELRAEILREREDFFREARLDKQHMIDRLAWTGPMLYDLCNTRFRACLTPEARKDPERSIMDLFDESLSKQELVDALDQLQQPRDAFKFLYALLQEHASNATSDEENYKISKTTLDLVRKTQVQRKDNLIRGYSPN